MSEILLDTGEVVGFMSLSFRREVQARDKNYDPPYTDAT